MHPLFKRKIRKVRFREAINRLLDLAAQGLLALAAVFLPAVLAEKLLAVSILGPPVIAALSAAASLYVIVRWFVTAPSALETALEIDKRLKLKERLSTQVAMEGREDDFLDAARTEALTVIKNVEPEKHFPITLSRRWIHASCVWLLVLLGALFLPRFDLLGFGKKAFEEKLSRRLVEEAKTEIKDAVVRLESMVTRIGDKKLKLKLAELKKFKKARTPEGVRREAVRKLEDLMNRLRRLKGERRFETLASLKSLLRKMNVSRRGLGAEFARALEFGRFDLAASLLEELQKKAEKGELSPAALKELSQKLKELAKQLEKTADWKDNLADLLSECGLDPSLADLSEEELLKALSTCELSPAEMKAILKRIAVLKKALSVCKRLGKKCGNCSNACLGEGDEIALCFGEFGKELSELEALEAWLALLEASLAEAEDRKAGLGFCSKPGTCKRPGLALRVGSNGIGARPGGRGKGFGPVAVDRKGSTSTRRTRSPSRNRPGPTIATWLVQENQEKGEARLTLRDAVQAAKDGASEAVRSNRIPARYRAAVERYFGGLAAPSSSSGK